jgi:DNA-directed RNA polymerase sigma subunit (sigma70/sigma32)
MHLTEIDHLTDFELSNKVKNENCSISLEELIKRHAGICDVMAKKFSFSNNYTTGVGYFDLFSEHKMIIYEAAKEFDVEKNVKFVTFVGSKMRFFCLKKINNLKKTNIFNITPPEDCEQQPKFLLL